MKMVTQRKNIVFAFFLIIGALTVWYAQNVFLLAFAGIILAIFINAIGRAAQKITRLPYSLALIIALVVFLGILTLIFWLYSPLIYDQFQSLIKELPQAVNALWSQVSPLIGENFISQSKLYQEFFFSNEKFLSQFFSIFTTTLGSIVGFIIFIILGFYMAFDPEKYVNWIVGLLPKKTNKKALDYLKKIWDVLNWWLLGKMLSMIAIGILAFVGLLLLDVSLAFILALLAAILTFIPYVGPILAAIPAILIGFAETPMKGLYVLLLYIGIQIIEGYFITPYIELKTVSIPPAWSILAQLLMVTLIGAIGLALATPLLVVVVAITHAAQHHDLKKV